MSFSRKRSDKFFITGSAYCAASCLLLQDGELSLAGELLAYRDLIHLGRRRSDRPSRVPSLRHTPILRTPRRHRDRRCGLGDRAARALRAGPRNCGGSVPPALVLGSAYFHHALVRSDVVVTGMHGSYNEHFSTHAVAFLLAFARHFNPYRDPQRWASTSHSCLYVAREISVKMSAMPHGPQRRSRLCRRAPPYRTGPAPGSRHGGGRMGR